MTVSRRTALARLATLWATPLAVRAADSPRALVVDFMISSGRQRTAWAQLINTFATLNPDLTIVANEFPQEDYKRHFATRLVREPVDLAFWFAGARLREAVRRGLLRPIDNRDTLQALGVRFTPASLDALQHEGKAYGAPVSFYPWGFFYHRPLFASLGLKPPADWSAFLAVSAKLRAAGVIPTAVGARNGWPAAAWFDYFNLRTNGIGFHRQLLAGEVPFGDPRVRAALTPWREMLMRGDFLAESVTEDWDACLPHLYRKSVGMVLLGAFAASKFPPQLAAEIGFFPFPQINPQVPRAEEAPLDVVVLPARGHNPEGAQRFLRFLAQHEALNVFNRESGMLSPRTDTAAEREPLRRAGRDLLDQARGLAFFFDRDARADLVEPAFAAMREFLLPPHDLNRLLQRLETARRAGGA